MFLKIIILLGLWRLLSVTGKPFICSGIYAGIVFIYSLAYGEAFIPVFISIIIVFLLASLYFWLLSYFNSGVLYWIVLFVGLLIGLV